MREARYFFNAGGIIKWAVSKTSTGQLADAEWNDLANTLSGQIYITGGAQTINGVSYTGTTKNGGTGTPTTLSTATGWYALTGTPVTIYQQNADTSPYTGQFIRIQASATSTVLTLTTTWVDPGGTAPATDVISGGTDTASPFTAFGTAPATVVTYIPPETTNLTATTTNRTPRRARLTEADLVRARREGVRLDEDLTPLREPETEKQLIRDPALVRAVDLLKGLAVVRRARL